MSQAKPSHFVYLLTALPLLLSMGCSDEAPSGVPGARENAEPQQQALTDVIPTSANCNLGHGPSRCIHVPLINASAPRGPDLTPGPRDGVIHTFVLDGVRDPLEWTGSVQLAYDHNTAKANDGKIYLALHRQPVPLGQPPVFQLRDFLRLYFEEIPVETPNDEQDIAGFLERFGVMRVYLDLDRFNGVDPFIGVKDRLYEFDIVKGVPLRSFRGSSNSSWIQQGSPGFQVSTAVSNCKPDPTTNRLLRCNAEVFIPLDGTALAKPDPLSSVLPGIGFAVSDFMNDQLFNERNSYPPIEKPGVMDSKGRLLDRRKFQTILAGRPEGFPLKFMSWNVRRYRGAGLKGTFEQVSNAQIGRYLALNDVVAIQEGWDTESVREIWTHANVVRKAKGLPLFRDPFPPPQQVRPDLQGFLEYVSAQVQGEPEVHGGLWIFSHLPAIKMGQHIFGQIGEEPGLFCEGEDCKPYCKGEDCLKSKGVQWVRLNLNPSDGPSAKCNLTPKGAASILDEQLGYGEIPASCPYSPSGDHYVDVFNTHLQASNSVICENSLDTVKEIVLLLTSPFTGPAFVAKNWLDHDFFCNETSESIREEQLRQMNAFIETSTPERDRPAILLGDFNVDGKNTESGEYKTLLHSLRIGPENTSALQPSDIINPWRFDFSDDYDHGDVLRERSDFSFGGPIGTFIGETIGSIVGNPVGSSSTLAADAGNVDGNERFDFILIRPPYRPDSKQFEQARWVALRPQKNADLWSSPWPGEKDFVIQPGALPPLAPDRFSDHKPVVSTIEMTPLAQPPKYHPTWKHDWTYRIVTANTSGIKDCSSLISWASDKCEQLDLYHVIESAIVLKSGSDLVLSWQADKDTRGAGKYGYCDNRSHAIWPEHSCTHDWFIEGKHTSVDQLSHDATSALFDEEVFDDHILVLPKKNNKTRIPWVKTIWDSPVYKDRAEVHFYMGDPSVNPLEWDTWAPSSFPEDSASIGACTGSQIPYICVENSFKELPPGEQF